MPLTRREFGRHVLAGVASTTLVGAGGCGSSGGAAAGGGNGGNACTLYPQQTAGPFYIDSDLLRSNITGGKAGVPLMVAVQVQSTNCAPLEDVAVDLWHCDAEGVYSGFEGQLGGLDTTGETFLRGTQMTDADGNAEFVSIYPGWYPGRTTHMHFKVHTSSTTEATSQIYFPEDVTAEVYRMPPYAARGPKDTPNAGDGISRANPTPIAMVTGDATAGFVATIVVTVA